MLWWFVVGLGLKEMQKTPQPNASLDHNPFQKTLPQGQCGWVGEARGSRPAPSLPAPPVESSVQAQWRPSGSGALVVWGVLVGLSFFSPFASVEMAC